MASDSDESVGGAGSVRGAAGAETRFRDLLLQLAGGKYSDDEDEEASDRSESPVESQPQPQPPREHIVLKLRAKDGQMESRLKRRRSDNVTMEEAMARLMETVELLQHGKSGAAARARARGAAPPPPPRRHDGSAHRRDAYDTTASVSREKYLKLKEKYNLLDERHSKLLDKYYWLEKEAVILMKLLIKKGVAPAPAPAPAADTRKVTDKNRVEEESSRKPAPAIRDVAVNKLRIQRVQTSRAGAGGGGGAGVELVNAGAGVYVTRAQWEAQQAADSPRAGAGAGGGGGGGRVELVARAVHVTRAQREALQAADSSRALVRILAIALFGHKKLIQNRDLSAERMAVLKEVLRQRLEAGGWAEPAARRVSPDSAPHYVQTYRSQLRYAKRKEAARVTAPPRITCGECHKRFPTRARLAAHARVHNGEHPYRCSECDASFKFHTQFNQHARAHTAAGAWARVCPRCGVAFPQLAHLHWHTRRAHRGAAPARALRAFKPVKPHPAWECVPLRDADADDAA